MRGKIAILVDGVADDPAACIGGTDIRHHRVDRCRDRVDRAALLVDCRPLAAYAAGHVPGTILSGGEALIAPSVTRRLIEQFAMGTPAEPASRTLVPSAGELAIVAAP